MVAGLFAAPRSAAADDATIAFIRALSNQAASVIRSDMQLTEKAVYFRQVIHQDFDLTGISRSGLGAYWRVASPAERRQFCSLFVDRLVRFLRPPGWRKYSVTTGLLGASEVFTSVADQDDQIGALVLARSRVYLKLDGGRYQRRKPLSWYQRADGQGCPRRPYGLYVGRPIPRRRARISALGGQPNVQSEKIHSVPDKQRAPARS
jgi:hypothetical protein